MYLYTCLVPTRNYGNPETLAFLRSTSRALPVISANNVPIGVPRQQFSTRYDQVISLFHLCLHEKPFSNLRIYYIFIYYHDGIIQQSYKIAVPLLSRRRGRARNIPPNNATTAGAYNIILYSSFYSRHMLCVHYGSQNIMII